MHVLRGRCSLSSLIGRLRDARGQSMVELAIVLPLMLTLVGGGLDLGRAYERQVKLEGAVRAAAELAAMTSTSQGEAHSEARRAICLGVDLPADCGISVTVAFASSTSAAGATTQNPLGVATVSAELRFRTLFPYPFLTSADGDLNLRAGASYAVLQGR